MSAQAVSYGSLGDFLDDAVKGVLIPIIYFDTNVFLDIIDKRDRASRDLHEYASKNQWQCVTSIFAKVEILDVIQFHVFKKAKRAIGWSTKRVERERHNRDLSPPVLGNISRSLTARIRWRCKGFKQYSCLLEDGWVKAEEMKRKTNLTDKDSIHLAEALAIACDLLVTRDAFLQSVAKKYIWAEHPSSAIQILKSVGAKI